MSTHDQNVKEQQSHFDNRIPTMLALGLREEAIEPLRRYVDLLWKSNEELNLISRKMTFTDLIDNHIIDCLLPLEFFPKQLSAAADFGAGGGMPGVMYAIQFPNMKYTLYEKSVRKREFLERCKAIAPNLEIAGEIPKDLGSLQIVTARAFKPIPVILDVSRSYYKAGGRYFLLKGRRETIEEEVLEAKSKFKELQVRISELKSPLLSVERHLVELHI